MTPIGFQSLVLKGVPHKQPLYGHLPPSHKPYKYDEQDMWGHGWRIKDKLISDVLLSTPVQGRVSVGRPAKSYICSVWS